MPKVKGQSNSRHSELQTLGTLYENTLIRYTKGIHSGEAQQGDAPDDHHDSDVADAGSGVCGYL